jgi:NAD(P)-dependent dehydrogenase (short-subunit alcohol dehydrogenase family)
LTKTALITGGTDGMGRVVAPKLAKAGFHVIVHGRSATRGAETVAEIKAAGGSAEFMPGNFARLSDIRRFATEVKARHPRIDLLVNNAGIGTGPEGAPRETTDDGLEARFGINYLSGFLMNHLLKDAVPKGGRIVNVASDGQHAIDFSDLQVEKGYSGEAAYCRSKVAMIMGTLDLAEELRAMGHEVVESLEDGAGHLFDLATNPKFDGQTGRYLNRGVDMPAHEQCYDPEARAKLRAVSLKLAGL